MKKTTLAMLVSLFAVAGPSLAQTQSPSTEIRESTDPAKIAEIERRAAELQAQQTTSSGTSSGASSSEDMSKSGRGHGGKHMSKSRSGGSGSANSRPPNGSNAK